MVFNTVLILWKIEHGKKKRFVLMGSSLCGTWSLHCGVFGPGVKNANCKAEEAGEGGEIIQLYRKTFLSSRGTFEPFNRDLGCQADHGLDFKRCDNCVALS
jgi:hypothetical protein